MRACLSAATTHARDFPNPGSSLVLVTAYHCASTRIGNFDDALRSNADANARDTGRSERNVFITSNDASIVIAARRATSLKSTVTL